MSRTQPVEQAMQRVVALRKECPAAAFGAASILAAEVERLEAQNARLRAAYHTMRVKVVQIANGEPEEMRDALFSLTKETDALNGGEAST